MSNHVHVLARSRSGENIPAGNIMQSVKSYTAAKGNHILGRTGTFWSLSYFDRDVRPGKFTTVMWYILNNPVKANLVTHWEQWPATYLNPDLDLLFRSSPEPEVGNR